ncbi:Type 1 glutamine amidotransferase-like domain-containing protein [Bacillus sp. V2I10]|uniref:Type 1 glutamine amidotransferase-like domain-containing protein n=1 Tax=Bacillus sp. V2I10 TaxID=3042276 RepID=UPI0027871853|nr:Type 1 glutamine amidotransferase-like domain-containing protein [Bacillus sp. V2I10]MDQ0859756.1 dipeptidase E [Bacillus sp. V2I10]
MAKIILTTNGFSSENIKKKFLEQIDIDKKEIRIAIITTASHHKENNKYAKKAKVDLTNLGFQKIEFCDVEHDNLDYLSSSNIIYLSGGNPFYLLHHLRKSGADNKLKDLSKRNTVFVGVSAGAMVLGPDIGVANFFTPEMNSIKLNNFNALKITKTAIFPHYDREELFIEKNGKSIEERLFKYENDNKSTVVRLRDADFIVENS